MIGPVVALFAATFPAAAAERSIAAELPRGYVGDFYWDDIPERQAVEIGFSAVEARAPDTLEATGCGIYRTAAKVTHIRVRMTVRLPGLAVTIWEHDPIDPGGFIIDGSHQGRLSDDLQTIDATWTSRATGEQGQLHLQAHAEVDCEPLQESDAGTARRR